MYKKNIIKTLLFAALIALVVFAFQNREIIEDMEHPEKLREYIRGFKFLAPIAFILLYSLRTLLVGFPVSVFAIMSGSIFGPVVGFIYSMIGAFISATISFFTGRYLARDFVNKHLSGKVKLLHGIDKKGFKLVLYLRLIMVMPFDLFGYAVGATKITYRDFILGTMIGIIPEFGLFAVFGDKVASDITIGQKLAFGLGLLAFIGIIQLLKKFIHKDKHEE